MHEDEDGWSEFWDVVVTVGIVMFMAGLLLITGILLYVVVAPH